MESAPPTAPIRIGCAGWAVRKDRAELYGSAGSHLERYAAAFACVEINSSFYKPHRRSTYERWAAAVPANFRFSAKLPRTITHERRLVDCADLLERFLDEVAGLGPKLGPLLAQFPPGFAYDDIRVHAFFEALRARHAGSVVCEPRHPSWFEPRVEALLGEQRIARVAADPACVPAAGRPGGWPGFAYWRLHGTPHVYYSAYGAERLAEIAPRLRAASGSEAWCIFDNTAAGAAPADATALAALLAERERTRDRAAR